jgi:hypothetical protein
MRCCPNAAKLCDAQVLHAVRGPDWSTGARCAFEGGTKFLEMPTQGSGFTAPWIQ